jgi:trigger factor
MHQLTAQTAKINPLLLGSKTFIPGFEENLIGTEAGEEKTFTLRISLRTMGLRRSPTKKVTFYSHPSKTLNEIAEPKLDECICS